MRVVFTDHVTDHTGGFLVRLVPVVAQLAHGKKHTAMHRLQSVARIRQRTTDDYAHCVVEVGLLEFVFDIDREDFFGQFAHGSLVPCSQQGPAIKRGMVSQLGSRRLQDALWNA